MTPTSPKRVGTCILGAGPHGLAMALHLQEADPAAAEHAVVIDPSGRWMSNWYNQFERLGIDVLRSPSVHHPGPSVDALSSFVRRQRLPTSGLKYDPPMSATFTAFTRHLVEAAGLAPPAALKPRSITRQEDGTLQIATTTTTVVADQVVIASNPHRRNIPEGLWPLCGRSPARLAHAADIDLTVLPDLTGERIAIMGGGLTAGHLATGAARRGAVVDLITRQPLRIRDFDLDPGWLGPKFLHGFDQCSDPRARLDLAMSARGGGTIPQWMRDELQHERITLHEGVPVVGAEAQVDHYRLDLEGGRNVEAERLWLATGTTPDISALRCLEPLLPDIAIIDDLPVPDDDLRIGLHPVYVMGRLATLTLGPAAGNLWGSRQAARRITRAITGTDVTTLSSRRSGARR